MWDNSGGLVTLTRPGSTLLSSCSTPLGGRLQGSRVSPVKQAQGHLRSELSRDLTESSWHRQRLRKHHPALSELGVLGYERSGRGAGLVSPPLCHPGPSWHQSRLLYQSNLLAGLPAAPPRHAGRWLLLGGCPGSLLAPALPSPWGAPLSLHGWIELQCPLLGRFPLVAHHQVAS